MECVPLAGAAGTVAGAERGGSDIDRLPTGRSAPRLEVRHGERRSIRSHGPAGSHGLLVTRCECVWLWTGWVAAHRLVYSLNGGIVGFGRLIDLLSCPVFTELSWLVDEVQWLTPQLFVET